MTKPLQAHTSLKAVSATNLPSTGDCDHIVKKLYDAVVAQDNRDRVCPPHFDNAPS